MKRVRWWRLLAALVVLAALAAAAVIVWRARQEAIQLVSNPIETRRIPTSTPIDFGMVYDDVTLTTRDGLELAAWYVPSENGALVIAIHGYKSSRGEMLNEAAMLHGHGFGILIPALRAHDMSDGTTITFGAREIEDLLDWIDMAGTLPEVDPDRILLLGNSLGGTIAIEAAAERPAIKAVATNSAFSSLEDTLETSIRFFTGMPPFPFAPLIAFWAERETGVRVTDVDATRSIGRISPRPILLMQGGADEVISIDSGRRLYEAAGEPRTLWFDERVGHARFDTALPGAYERRVLELFTGAAVRP